MLTLTTLNSYNNSPNFSSRSKLADRVAQSVSRSIKKAAKPDHAELEARDALQNLSNILFINGNQNGRISIHSLRKAFLELAEKEDLAFSKKSPNVDVKS